MEIAFVSSNRMQAEMDTKNAGISARPLSVFFKHPNKFVSTMLVGNNIVLVVYGILFAKLFDSTIFADIAKSDPGIALALDTILSTIIVLFTGEFLPKMFFKSQANRLLKAFAIPAYLCYIVLYPISSFSTLLSNTIMRLFGMTVTKDSGNEEFSKLDLDFLVQERIEKADDNSRTLNFFQNALELSDIKVRDCMIPRTEICAIQNLSSLEELKQMFVETGKSKIIVFKEDIDHIIGYIHSSEMFKDENNGDGWRSNVRTMPFVPETMPAKKLMQIFLSQKKSLGVVVDEFGGTAGIVSLEDICEEIFGEIEDEHDKSNLLAKKLSDTEFIFSARQEIDYLNEQFNLELPESEEYQTLAGLVLHINQGFPAVNEEIRVDNYRVRVLKKSSTKIDLVKLIIDNKKDKE
ncbi:MAG: HlyC/CorC family transporter [Bacteroidaceae bacterium]|nr:HlyC/CorC family transporter [Bacteroidaceae bacterium]